MKKFYNKPVIEIIKFDYQIATANSSCHTTSTWTNKVSGCADHSAGAPVWTDGPNG